MYLTYCNLLIAQDLWQAHSQIMSILFLKEFINLIVNTNMMIKQVKLLELYVKYVTAFLNAQTRDNLTGCCLCCNKKYKHKFDEKLKKGFFNTYNFSNRVNNKFILLFHKCTDPNEYMDHWEKLNKTPVPEKKKIKVT